MKYLLLIIILLPFVNLFSQEIYYVEHGYKFYKNVLTSLRAFKCIDEDNCILLKTDNNYTGIMLEKTTDGGNSWTLIYADTSFKSNDSVYYPDYWGEDCAYFADGKIIILTNRGHIIISEDFGASFKEYPQIENYGHQSSIILDSMKALTISTNLVYYPGAKKQFLKSTDGCKSWEAFPVPDSIAGQWDLFTTLDIQKDKSIMIYCEPTDGIERDSTKKYFYHTDFDGSFWKLLEVPNFVNYIYFFDEKEAFATGKFALPGPFNDTAITCKTYDGGKTWKIKFKTTWPHEMFSSHLVHNDTNIFIAGSGFGFLKSTDKGESWYKPTFQMASGVDDTTNTLLSAIHKYFDNGTVFFSTFFVTRVQFLKGTRVSTSISSPSMRPKRIYPNPVAYGTDFIAEYEIETSGHLKMYLSDLAGRELCRLYNTYVESGSYSTSLRLPEHISSGSYWLVSEQNGYKHVQLLNVVK